LVRSSGVSLTGSGSATPLPSRLRLHSKGAQAASVEAVEKSQIRPKGCRGQVLCFAPALLFADVTYSRNEAIVLSYSSDGYGMKQIGDFFGLHYSRVSQITREAKGKT